MCRRIWCGYFNLSVPWSDTFVRSVYGYYISDSNYSEFPNISIFNLSIAKNLRSRLFHQNPEGNYNPLSTSVKCTSKSLEYFFSCSNRLAPRSK